MRFHFVAILVLAVTSWGCAGDDSASSMGGSETGGTQADAGGGADASSTSTSSSDGDASGVDGGGDGDSSTGEDTATTGSSGDDTEVWKVRVDKFPVKPTETDYACFEFTTTFEQLSHITKFVPVIDNEQFVHHYVLETIPAPSGKGQGYSCYDLAGSMIWAWAVGGAPYELPEEAGYLVGDTSGGQLTLRLQVHYNNPLELTGEIDNSGLDIHYTSDLRANDAGTIIFNGIAGLNIPAGKPAYEVVGNCSSIGLSTIINEPVTVFGSFLHAHEIGKAIWTEVWRGGSKVGEINRNDAFSFENQDYDIVNFELRPGDEVRNHCVYDSTGRTTATIGGVASNQEMCWNVVSYYPKSNLGEHCILTF